MITASATPFKILIVEDTLIAARLAEMAFQMKGCITVLAKSGEEALEKIDASFHFILMDLGLPKMNGFETADAIRHLACLNTSSIPIYALTTHDKDQSMLEALHKAGMNGFFVKPLTSKIRDFVLEKTRIAWACHH